MTPLERKKIMDTLQEEFNLYKSAGSTLLQAGRITPKEYYKGVRDKGIQLNILGENEYPTTLPGYVEPIFRVTGATLGAVAGSILGAPGGPAGTLAGASAGAGVGGGAATLAFQEFSEFLNPDLPVMPFAEKVKISENAATVDAVGTLAIGGVGNIMGNILRRGGSLSQRGYNKLKNLSDEQLTKLSNKVPERKTGILEKLFVSQTQGLKKEADEVAKSLEKEGFEPYVAQLGGGAVQGLYSGAGRFPILGRPVAEKAVDYSKALTNRFQKGAVRINESNKSEILNPILGRQIFKVDSKGKINRVIGNQADEQNQVAATAIAGLLRNIKQESAKKAQFYKEFDEGFAGINSEAIKNKFKNKELYELNTQNPLIKAADEPQFNSGNELFKSFKGVMTRSGLKDINNSTPTTLQKFHTELRKEISSFNSKIKVGQAGTQIVDTNAETVRNGLRGLMNDFEKSLVGVTTTKGDSLGNLLSRANSQNERFNALLRRNSDVVAYSGANSDLIKVIGKQDADAVLNDAGLSFAVKSPNKLKNKFDLLNDTYKTPGEQIMLRRALGQEEYKKLVDQEMTDIFEDGLANVINKTGTFDDVKFNNLVGVTNATNGVLLRKKLELAYGKQKGTQVFKSLGNIGNILKKFPDHPNISSMIARRQALMSASTGLGASALGVGAFATGGMVTGVMTIGMMYGLLKLLSKPYGASLIAQAQKNTAAGFAAGNRVLDEISTAGGQIGKFQASKERILQLLDPEKYRLYKEGLRQTGLETYSDEFLPSQKTNVYGDIRR
tara:strand:- start:1551 stop:3899 length:2349 start_codon:yes stop_codon:yes gene_type:complete